MRTAVVDLDDLCDRFVLDAVRAIDAAMSVIPGFRATIFVIPALTSIETVSMFRERYGEAIELAAHGTDHRDRNEFLRDGDTVAEVVRMSRELQLVQGFKAPWWRLSQDVAHELMGRGFWVACNDAFRISGPYVYDWTSPNHASVRWHGHVQSQRIKPPWAGEGWGPSPKPNGLEESLQEVEERTRGCEFKLISELF